MNIVKRGFEALRRVQYTMYWGWALLALVFVAFIFEETTELAGRRFDSEQPVTWIPLGLLVLVVVSCRILGLIGRKWERRLRFAHECFWRTFIQTCGMIFSVLLNEMITKLGLGPLVLVLFCGFAFCHSQFLRLGVRLEFTSTLLSTTLIVVWSKKPLEDHISPAAWASIAVLMMMSLGNYFDQYFPASRREAAQGRLSGWGSDNMNEEKARVSLSCAHCGSLVLVVNDPPGTGTGTAPAPEPTEMDLRIPEPKVKRGGTRMPRNRSKASISG